MRDLWDAIASSTPVNKTAAVVAAAGGGQDSAVRGMCQHWKAPPPTRVANEEERGCSTFEDLSGRQFGQFAVIGISVERMGKQQTWIVRCVCGDYEPRTARSIRNQKNKGDRCSECRNLDHLRSLAAKKARGILPATSIEDAVKAIQSP